MAWVQNAYDQLKPYSLGHYINFVNFEAGPSVLQCLLLCAVMFSMVRLPSAMLCCFIRHVLHLCQTCCLQVPEDTEMSFSPEAWAKVQAAKSAYDPHHLLRELDFYHNDAGRGPLDAASVPVSQ